MTINLNPDLRNQGNLLKEDLENLNLLMLKYRLKMMKHQIYKRNWSLKGNQSPEKILDNVYLQHDKVQGPTIIY